MNPKQRFTTLAAARSMAFPVSPDDIARLARTGRIPASRVGRRWLLTAAAVQEARELLGRPEAIDTARPARRGAARDAARPTFSPQVVWSQPVRDRRLMESQVFLKTLLLVEDDPDIAILLRMTLDPSRYEIESAGDLASARELLAEKPPDLVILDVGLPDGNGLELCREVKAARPSVPVVILTALSRQHRALEAQAHACGADAFVEKPFDPDDLQATAERLLTAS